VKQKKKEVEDLSMKIVGNFAQIGLA